MHHMEETSNVKLDACLVDVLAMFLFDLVCGSVFFAVKLLKKFALNLTDLEVKRYNNFF